MKKVITKISGLAMIASILFTSQVFAISQFEQADEKDKLIVKIHAPVIRALVDMFDLTEVDLAILESQLEEVKAITVTYAEQELDIVFDDCAFNTLGIREDCESRQLEDWMFNDLVKTEDPVAMESWMFAPDYYEEEYQGGIIEDWMLDELVEPEEEIEIEDWMFVQLNDNK